MASPFPANSTLVFQVPSSSGEIDELGNPSATTVPLTVTAYLKELRNRSRTNDGLDGGEVSRVLLEGRINSVELDGVAIEPAALPAEILPGAKATAVISDPAGQSADLVGDFFLEAAIASAFGTSAVMGAPIRGYLVTQVAWGEAL
ncbi:MAG TPA: hypothetical protein V6C88_19780 [Chroococcidiopsis sp.]